MKALLRVLVRLGVVLVVLGSAIALLAIQHAPLVPQASAISVEDVQRARRLLVQHDPRRASDGVERTVVLTQQDVTLLTQYAASRWRRAVTRVALHQGAADVKASIAMPENPFGRWMNLDATLTQAEGMPRVGRLTVGRIPVPSLVADPVVRWLLSRVGSSDVMQLADQMVRSTTMTPQAVRVRYAWRADASGRVSNMLIAPADLARLEASNATLAAIIGVLPPGRNVQLVTLLEPMFAEAAGRAPGGDAVAENRAILATLALYATGRSLGRWVPEASRWPKPARRNVLLAGRADLAKHFLVSAVVAAQAGTSLADALGQTKEVDDSRGGTGYSFVDIAADRAGTRFGDEAVQSADALRTRVARGLDEADFMPDVGGLPEFMSAEQFAGRFDSVGGPRHQAMMQQIEARIARLPLYRR